MTVIVAPGMSPKNQDLLDQAEQRYDDPVLLAWEHWGDEPVDAHRSLQRLEDALENNPDAVLVAKSFGVGLSLRLLEEGVTPQKAFFLGTPLASMNAALLADLPESLDLVFVQNEHDPHGSYEQLRRAIPQTCEVRCVQGNDTHVYAPPRL